EQRVGNTEKSADQRQQPASVLEGAGTPTEERQADIPADSRRGEDGAGCPPPAARGCRGLPVLLLERCDLKEGRDRDCRTDDVRGVQEIRSEKCRISPIQAHTCDPTAWARREF